MSIRALPAIVGTIAVLTLVSACGSSGGQSAGQTGSQASGTPAGPVSDKTGANAGPIIIGMVNSLSGQYSSLGQPQQKAIELLASQLNAAGGIDGRQVKVVYEDDQTTGTQAVIGINKLQGEHPSAIIGPNNSTACDAIVDKVNKIKIPMVTMCSSDSQVDPIRPYVFMATLPTDAQAAQVGKYLEANNESKVAILYDSNDFGQAGLKWLSKQDTLSVVGSASYNESATTFLPQLQSLLAKKPQAVIVWGAGSPIVTIAKEYKQLGTDAALVMSAAAASPQFIGATGDAGNGIVMASSMASVYQNLPDSNPTKALVAKMATDYKAKYGSEISQFTDAACGAWFVIVDAIKAGGTDPTAIRNAIESKPAVGCHGTYHYSPTDHEGIGPSDVWMVAVQGGKLVPTQFSVDSAKNGS